MPVHGDGAAFATLAQAQGGDRGVRPGAARHAGGVSAHVMGGAPLGPDPRARGGRRRPAAITISRTCYVLDGSLFPTSIGANPQLSIYGIAARLATGLAAALAPARR